MGSVGVVHRSVGSDPEHAHQVNRVDGGAGLVEDAVAPQPGVSDVEGVEGSPEREGVDRPCLGCALLGDEQVRVPRGWPSG
jgi:hypothetical protein